MCGLLSDDDGDDPDEDPPEVLDEGDEPEADGGAAGGEPVDEPSEPDDSQAGEARGEGEENDLDVESTLKDLAARMSRLSSHIEGIEDDREQMEDKLDEVENQLGQLGNLAEVVSSQYNPFITEDAPGNPEWDQRDAETRGGGDPMRRPPEQSPGPSDRDERVLEEAALEEASPEHSGDAAGDESEAAEEGEPGEGLDDAFDDGLPPALDDGDQDLLTDEANPTGDGETGPRERLDGPPDPATLDLSDSPDPTAEGEDAFDRNVLLLEWVEHMMEQVGRDGLLDLLEYYEALGWLDEPLKNRALRVATGIDVDAEAGPDGGRAWRGDTDLHERALVVLERLGGRRERPESRLEELQLDLDRIFDR